MRHSLLAATALLFASAPSYAIDLIGGMSADNFGFGQITQPRNDDNFSGELTLPFTLNFFGQNYGSLWVNNNGNVTFNGGLSTYTPRPFPIANQPVIAPWWADVDTRNPTSGQVYIGATGVNGRQASVVTWNNVGYYNTHADKLNDFQLVLIDRGDTGAGNFDVQFRYNRLEWTTGDASGGAGGFGGTPAQAGYDAGDGVNYFVLPGSFTNDVLNLVNTSNVSLDTPGLWYFQIRNGEIGGGETPETPLMPDIVTHEGFEFTYDVVINTPVFVDPIVATGYDYVVNSGPQILEAWFGDVGDADGYQVYGWDGSGFNTLLGSVSAETWFDFGGAVSRFAVRGIDPALGLDPNDPTAFITGFIFDGVGTVNMTMAPVTINTDVPEPATWALMIAGFGLVGGALRRRNVVAA
jgi:hypothetical protein